MKCEAEVGRRAENGQPTMCGATAKYYCMSGGIAQVNTWLCDLHMGMFKHRGYKLTKTQPPEEVKT